MIRRSPAAFLKDWLFLSLAKARNFVTMGKVDLPNGIQIMTAEACNRRCHYCPQSIAPRKQRLMDDYTWHKILWRLSDINWKGLITPVWYQEPSIQPNFSKRLQELRAAVPKAFITIPTNGDKPELIHDWIALGADRVQITQHEPSRPDWFVNVMKVASHYPSSVVVAKLLRVHSSAELMREFAPEAYNVENCDQISSGISIDIEGNVCICCADYFHQFKLGNVTERGILDIWYDKKYVEIRKKLRKGIPSHPMCAKCMSVPMP